MKKFFKITCIFIAFISIGLLFSSYTVMEQNDKVKFRFPYKQAGLTQRQAAAHLLSRFTFGATPGQIDEVVKTGLEKWFANQLEANLSNDSLQQMLVPYETLTMSNATIVNTFPQGGQILRMAVKDGFVNKDSVDKGDRKEYRDQLAAYMQKNGLKPQQELYRQLINQKILRAAYSNNQLQEVLASFWFNHFNVSLTKNDCASFVTSYERDVIRPNVMSKFETLLLATAKSPAMLTYLDNFRSVASDNTPAPANKKVQEFYMKQMESQMQDSTTKQIINKLQKAKNTQGLNENYAREIMELHTLGVDGGYTQADVTNAAKVLTGWTIYPMNDAYGGQAVRKMLERVGEERLQQQGFVHDGDFMFAANKHDKTEKIVLNEKFSANGGYEEGQKLITMLAHHPSTAKFISKKMAIRFVNDNPSPVLIDKMAKTFLEKDGDIKQVLLTMVTSPEFWSKEALREKTKSPFELAISAVRSLDAEVKQPFQLYNWITKMGERMYYYQAPTGFPDKGQYWINTGSLLNRMNFGLALASQRIPGISFSLATLNNNHEPESTEAALLIYGKLLMPERDLSETIKRLTPLINDPKLTQKVIAAADKTPVPQTAMDQQTMAGGDDMMMAEAGNKKLKPIKENPGKKNAPNNSMQQLQMYAGNNTMLSQVTGIIIGSPEFQRK